jgi:hypothetical protein
VGLTPSQFLAGALVSSSLARWFFPGSRSRSAARVWAGAFPIKASDFSEADALATALLPLPNGLDITTDLIQVRKVMTGEES